MVNEGKVANPEGEQVDNPEGDTPGKEKEGETPEAKVYSEGEYKSLQRALSERELQLRKLQESTQANTAVMAAVSHLGAEGRRQREAFMLLAKSLDKIRAEGVDTLSAMEPTASSELSRQLSTIFDESDKEEMASLLVANGLDVNDPDLEDIRNAPSAKEGMARLKVYLKGRSKVAQKQPQDKVETDEDRESRIRAKVEAEMREKQNLREVSKARPSGAPASTFSAIEKAYIKGEISATEYQEKARQHGKL